MYRNQKNKRNLPAVKPVFVSRKRNDLEVEKENQATNDNDEIPASQDILSSQGIPGIPASQNASQARFASQRHQIRLTQGQQQARGKNYFEIALISAKVVASEIGSNCWNIMKLNFNFLLNCSLWIDSWRRRPNQLYPSLSIYSLQRQHPQQWKYKKVFGRIPRNVFTSRRQQNISITKISVGSCYERGSAASSESDELDSVLFCCHEFTRWDFEDFAGDTEGICGWEVIIELFENSSIKILIL